MARAPLLSIAIAAFTGACASFGPGRPAITDQELLSGAALAVAADASPPIGRAEAFGLDADTRAFVAASVGSASEPRLKLQRLVDGMDRDGLFTLEYSGIVTRTAQATFDERRGNCLSFTMLFVSLARAAGLDVHYRIVEVPPTWTNEAELVVVRTHINAVVKTASHDDTVVDFNITESAQSYPWHDVDDAYVLGLFYANVGAEALIEKDYELAFRYFRGAVRTAPQLDAAWVNLGALYSRVGLSDYAEAAYLRALEIAPSQRSALSNLARLYSMRGDEALAEVYRQRVRRYQESNPYYHYAIAQEAYANGRFDVALDEVRRALRLKRDEHQFYLLQGGTLLAIDRPDAASAAFNRGRGYAAAGKTVADYDDRVGKLAAASGAVLVYPSTHGGSLRRDAAAQTVPAAGIPSTGLR